jgi:hypothetical protein
MVNLRKESYRAYRYTWKCLTVIPPGNQPLSPFCGPCFRLTGGVSPEARNQSFPHHRHLTTQYLTCKIASPSQEHISTHLQRLQAARLEQLIDYVAEPYFFLTCKSCRVALPLSRIPAHFSSPKYHPYRYKDCVDAHEARQALYPRSRPVKLRNEDDLRNWSFPVPHPAPIPQHRTLYVFVVALLNVLYLRSLLITVFLPCVRTSVYSPRSCPRNTLVSHC